VTFAWTDSLDGVGNPTARRSEQRGTDNPGGDGAPGRLESRRGRTSRGTALRNPQAQGLPDAGPITIGEGRMADQMVQVVYNTQHRMPWHWPVPAYLVTKAIGSGIALWLALALLLGLFALPVAGNVVMLGASLFFIGATTALLVYDLERPERFLRILTRPQWRSWLTRGAFLLVGFSGVTALWFLLEAVGTADGPPRLILAVLTVPLALGAAVYTAFLFGQAEGRDLWQSSLLPVHLIVQALLAGSGIMLVVAAVVGGVTGGGSGSVLTDAGLHATRVVFAGALIVDLLVTFLGEFGMPHASEGAARAAHDIRAGRYRLHFWVGSLVMGHVGPLLLLFAGTPATDVLAGLLAVAGLYLYEYAFVMAPQHVPNS
jgi:formate-dependent nitrite reductase membrane component NrfD